MQTNGTRKRDVILFNKTEKQNIKPGSTTTVRIFRVGQQNMLYGVKPKQTNKKKYLSKFNLEKTVLMMLKKQKLDLFLFHKTSNFSHYSHFPGTPDPY